MSRSAYTAKVFGIYLLILGVALILVPNVRVAFVAFWLLGFAGPALILFGVIDVLGGAWTHVTLKSQDRA